MPVPSPAIMILVRSHHGESVPEIRRSIARLGGLPAAVFDVDRLTDPAPDGVVFSEDMIASLATTCAGLMVYSTVIDTPAGRRVVRACREAAAALGRTLETVPPLTVGSGPGGVGEDLLAAWIDHWIERHRPANIRAAAQRLEARRASARREADLPYVWTADDTLAIRDVGTGEIVACVDLSERLQLCRTADDGHEERLHLQHRLDGAFEAYHLAQTMRAQKRKEQGL